MIGLCWKMYSGRYKVHVRTARFSALYLIYQKIPTVLYKHPISEKTFDTLYLKDTLFFRNYDFFIQKNCLLTTAPDTVLSEKKEEPEK